MKDNTQQQIVIYQGKNAKINVNVDANNDTVWLNRQQLADLFGRDIKTIGKHINNALSEELSDISVVAKFATTAADGKTYNVEHYNLDMILSVGYRVKSNEGIMFRRWANSVLRQHLLKGYTVNKQRLMQLGKMIEVFSRANIPEVSGVAEIVGGYLGGLNLLEQYDEAQLTAPKGRKGRWQLTYNEARQFLDALPFTAQNPLFANERSDSFQGIIAGLYQSFGGEELYPSVENKAANLLYQIVKDHPFSDGNKRSAAALFVYFLDRNRALRDKIGRLKIAPNALAAITLMIALSKPAEKDTMVTLVMNLIDLD